jgi:hypothetical protein
MTVPNHIDPKFRIRQATKEDADGMTNVFYRSMRLYLLIFC